MCGIIGYVGPRECKPLLLQGLERLEYRGYDSAGIALREAERARLRPRRRQPPEPEGRGRPERLHRHARPRPHALGDARRRHRGERAPADRLRRREALDRPERDRRELPRAARAACSPTATRSRSETDAETVSHLIERHYDGDLAEAVRQAFTELEGHFTFVVIHHDHPDLLVGARHQTPLVVGIGEGEMFLASNAAAFLRETRTRPVPGRRRDRRRSRPTAPSSPRADGTPVEHDADRARLGRRGRREGRLRDVHAQGDLRAARGASPRRSATASATARLVLEGLGH